MRKNIDTDPTITAFLSRYERALPLVGPLQRPVLQAIAQNFIMTYGSAATTELASAPQDKRPITQPTPAEVGKRFPIFDSFINMMLPSDYSHDALAKAFVDSKHPPAPTTGRTEGKVVIWNISGKNLVYSHLNYKDALRAAIVDLHCLGASCNEATLLDQAARCNAIYRSSLCLLHVVVVPSLLDVSEEFTEFRKMLTSKLNGHVVIISNDEVSEDQLAPMRSLMYSKNDKSTDVVAGETEGNIYRDARARVPAGKTEVRIPVPEDGRELTVEDIRKPSSVDTTFTDHCGFDIRITIHDISRENTKIFNAVNESVMEAAKQGKLPSVDGVTRCYYPDGNITKTLPATFAMDEKHNTKRIHILVTTTAVLGRAENDHDLINKIIEYVRRDDANPFIYVKDGILIAETIAQIERDAKTLRDETAVENASAFASGTYVRNVPLHPDETNPVALWGYIHHLRMEAKGPDQHETWRDAAIFERREKETDKLAHDALVRLLAAESKLHETMYALFRLDGTPKHHDTEMFSKMQDICNGYMVDISNQMKERVLSMRVLKGERDLEIFDITKFITGEAEVSVPTKNYVLIHDLSLGFSYPNFVEAVLSINGVDGASLVDYSQLPPQTDVDVTSCVEKSLDNIGPDYNVHHMVITNPAKTPLEVSILAVLTDYLQSSGKVASCSIHDIVGDMAMDATEKKIFETIAVVVSK